MNKIILIGGAPTLGKTYIARNLAKQLSLPWISTDSIREMMAEIVNKKDYKDLFLFRDSKLTAEKAFKTYTPKQIMLGQKKESVDVWKAVKAFIKTDYVFESYIVEGIAILPSLVHKAFGNNKNIKPIFLVSNDVKRISKVIHTRGLWDDADKYPDSVKDREVEWVCLFNEYIIKEAKKYDYPVYQVDRKDFSINNIIKLCK